MAPWSSKKKTHISSQTYNIDGLYKDRPKFLQTVILGGVLNNPINITMGDTITSSYLGGPGIAFKNFIKWAERNNYWGISRQNKSYQKNPNRLNYDEIDKVLPKNGKGETYIMEVEIGYPTIDDYVLQYMLANVDNFYRHIEDNTTYEELEENYGYFIKESYEDNSIPQGTVDIYYDNKKIKNLKIPENDLSKEYMIITYATKDKIDVHEIVNDMTDIPNPLVESSNNWEEIENTIIEDIQPKVTTSITKINSKTGEIIDIQEESSLEKVKARKGYAIYKYVREDGSTEYQKNTYRELIEEERVEEIIKEEEEEEFYIVKSTITRKLITGSNTYELKIDSAYEGNTSINILIYEHGTGNKVLDNQLKSSTDTSSLYFPIVPIRANSRNITRSHWGSIYNINKKAFKKLTKGNYDDLLNQINKSGSLGDINTGFMQLGVALNTRDPAGKSYIYEYFRLDLLNNGASVIDLDKPPSEPDPGNSNNQGKINSIFSSLFRPKPSGIYLNSDLGFYINFRYNSGRIERKKGRYGNLKNSQIHIKYEYKFLRRYCYEYEYVTNKKEGYTDTRTRCVVEDRMEYKIYKQFEDYYEIVYVYDPRHVNTVKDGKSVTSYPFDYNEGEEESACILPLSAAAIKNMSLKNVTQLSYGIKHLTFTAWKITKTKWYKRGIFKIAMVVVAIVVSIYFPPAGVAGGTGILGANAALGATLGLTGTAAIVAGAAINAMASMVVASVISNISGKLFGDKIGAIVGAVASVVVSGIASNMSNGASFAEAMQGLYKADNLLSITKAVGTGYVGYKNAKTLDVLERTQKMIEDIESQIKDVESKMSEFNGNNAIIDPLYLTDVFGGFFEGESSQEFLDRTLMTGSDIAEATHNLITNFANINLTLNK